MSDSIQVNRHREVLEGSLSSDINTGSNLIETLVEYRNALEIISKCSYCLSEFKRLKNNGGMSDISQTIQTPKRDGLFDIIDSR